MKPKEEIEIMEIIEDLSVKSALVNYRLRSDGNFTPEKALKRLGKNISVLIQVYEKNGLTGYLTTTKARTKKGGEAI